MPRVKRNISNAEKEQEFRKKLAYKFNSLKTDFETGKVENFQQIEALVPLSVLARQMHMGYAAFKNKCNSPGDFTNNELIRLAELINIDINILLKFIYSSMKFRNKFTSGEPIRL
jgi:hypothetical protein